jgi:hypothetical protein
MPSPLPESVRRLWRGRYVIAYVALATTFFLHLRSFYHSDTGFTSLILFGDDFAPRRIARLADVPIYNVAGAGYDGQFYAQIAVAGNPFDPALLTALDSPSYRNRRVLVPALAHVLGLGRPTLVLNMYALFNVFAWVILAALLARWWFPPTDLQNLLRWAGFLFGVGMLLSVTRSLSDGPSLLLIAAGVRAVERGRPWLGAVLLGAAGLARETSVLAAPALLPGGIRVAGRRAWMLTAGRIAICVLPTALWMLVLRAHFGYAGGGQNFAAPLFGFAGKLGEVHDSWRTGGFGVAMNEFLAVLALAVQVGLILGRPRPREPWWAVGASFALFAFCLSDPVWEGNLGAATRVLLPLTLAFNVLAPRTRRGLVLLLVGNLTVLSATEALRPHPRSVEPVFAGGVTARYPDNWSSREINGPHNFRWASGNAEMKLQNPGASRTATIDFALRSVAARTVVIRVGDVERSVAVPADVVTPVHLGPLTLGQGTTVVRFSTEEPPWPEPGPAKRMLSFSVHDLFVR